VPVSQETLEKISQLADDDFSEVMKCHPGFARERQLRSLWAVLEIFLTACTDLLTAIQRFSKHDLGIRTPSRERALVKILAQVQKEIFAASAAAGALEKHTDTVRKQTERAKKPLITKKEYEDLRAAVLDLDQHEFVVELRNNLSHSKFIESAWRITYSVGGKEATFEFTTSQLLSEGEFTERAVTYIGTFRDKIDVATLFKDYRGKIEKLYAQLHDLIESRLPVEVTDYRGCVDSHTLARTRSIYRFLLKLGIARQVDPYAHLAEHLDPEQLEEVNQLPARSIEQVNRIIELVDQAGVCDDEIRELVLRLFKVK
jgi:hypothetical protein